MTLSNSALFPLIPWLLLVLNVSSIHLGEYRYIFTYGVEPVVCHAAIRIFTHDDFSRAYHVWLEWVECVSSGNIEDPHLTWTFSDNEKPYSYSISLGQSGENEGQYAYEIGIDQDQVVADFIIPAMAPRVNMIVDSQGVPQWFCEYRQGGLQIAQDDGSVVPPDEPPRNPDPSTSGGTICSSTETLIARIGVWLLCQASCKARPKYP